MDAETERRRQVNVNRVHLFGTNEQRVIAFVCECGDGDCRETALLTGPQFQARAADGERIVHPRHTLAA